MTDTEFRLVLAHESEKIEKARLRAFSIHDSVGQKYGKTLPYGHHLQMVADITAQYGHSVCDAPEDVPAIIFGAYFHDAIEDARQSYNDIRRTAADIGLSESQSFTAAEIVYALTNEKGRNRQERQSGKYYSGIRETPYAPFVKMADRLANISFSFSSSDVQNMRMRSVYASEWPDFLSHVRPRSKDIRFTIPDGMIKRIESLIL